GSPSPSPPPTLAHSRCPTRNLFAFRVSSLRSTGPGRVPFPPGGDGWRARRGWTNGVADPRMLLSCCAMSVDPLLFRDLVLVLAAAVVGGTLAWLTRQPLVLGYVVGGMAISPFTPGPSLSGASHLEAFAEIGVVLLMFSIGIEFSLKDLGRVKWIALIGG